MFYYKLTHIHKQSVYIEYICQSNTRNFTVTPYLGHTACKRMRTVKEGYETKLCAITLEDPIKHFCIACYMFSLASIMIIMVG